MLCTACWNVGCAAGWKGPSEGVGKVLAAVGESGHDAVL